MKYYLIFLKHGRVVDVCSYDDEDARDKTKYHYLQRLGDGFDDIQSFTSVG